jgi:hypothetical protein
MTTRQRWLLGCLLALGLCLGFALRRARDAARVPEPTPQLVPDDMPAQPASTLPTIVANSEPT